MSGEEKSKVDSSLGYGEFTHGVTGETRWGCILSVVGFKTPEDAKLFCDTLAPVLNKEFSLGINPMGQPAAADSAAVH